MKTMPEVIVAEMFECVCKPIECVLFIKDN